MNERNYGLLFQALRTRFGDSGKAHAFLSVLTDALEETSLTVYVKKVTVNRRRRVACSAVTPEVRAGVLADFRNTEMNQNEIAAKWGINIGRVNEIVHQPTV